MDENRDLWALSYNELIAFIAQLRKQLKVKTTTPDVASVVADIAELRTQVTGSRSGSYAGQESSNACGIRTSATEFRMVSDLNKRMEKFR